MVRVMIVKKTHGKEYKMELPKVKVKATAIDPKVLILYAPPKAGKTTILSQLEDTLIIDLEDGTKYLEALKVNVSSLRELHALGEEIKKQGRPYRRIAIDTVTKLEELCEGAATNNYKKSPIGKNFDGDNVLSLPNGAGYFWLREAYKQWMAYVKGLADQIILVGHLKDKQIEKKGKEVSAKDIDLTGKIKSITCADADAIGYLYRDSGELRINFQGSDDDIVCGGRCQHLINQDIPFDWSKIYIEGK